MKSNDTRMAKGLQENPKGMQSLEPRNQNNGLTLSQVAKSSLPVNSYDEIFQSRSTTFKNYQKQEAVIWLSSFLFNKINAIFDLEKPLTKERCLIVSEMIYDDFGSIKVSEMPLIIKHIVRQKVYNRIDAQVLYSFFQSYYQESREVVAHHRESAHKRLMSSLTESDQAVPVPENLVKLWKEKDVKHVLSNVGKKAGIRPSKVSESREKEKQYKIWKDKLIAELTNKIAKNDSEPLSGTE